MNRRRFVQLIAAFGSRRLFRPLMARAATVSGVMAPVLTRGMNNARTGCNSNETILTQANVATQGIRVLFSLPMEGDARGAESQTLIVPSVNMDDGTTRDIALISAMNGLIYTFDGNESDIEWVKKASEPVNGTPAIDGWMVNDHWSFLSTGVVDNSVTPPLWYGVAWTDPNGNAATARYYLHTYNVATGNRVGPPVLVDGASNGQSFNSMMRKQRSSLLLATFNGVKTILFACGTVSESGAGAAGWIFAYDVASASFKGALALTTGEGAGVWMAGGGLCADTKYLYCVTGNGGFDGVTDWGESALQISYLDGAFKVEHGWAPWTDNQREGKALAAKQTDRAKLAGINASTSEENLPVNIAHMKMKEPGAAMGASDSGWFDEDYGSGGCCLVDGYLITVGKDGIVYVINTANFPSTVLADLANPAANYAKLASPPIWATNFPGYQYNPAPQDATTLDFLPGGKTRHNHSTPVSFWSSINGTTVFFWGENSPLRAFKFENGTLTYLAQGNEVASINSVNSPGGMPGGFMAISCNGTVPGTAILWATIPYGNANQTVTNGRLLAYDAEHFNNGVIKVLWDSQAPMVDGKPVAPVVFPFNKFNPPVPDGGKLFLPTYGDYTLVLGLV